MSEGHDIEKEVAWALENRMYLGQPAGYRVISKHFGISQELAKASARLAKAQAAETDIVSVNAPALAATRRFDPTDPAYRAPTIERLRRRAMTLTELKTFLGTNEEQAQEMLRSLKSAGYLIEEAEGAYRLGKLRPDTMPVMKNFDRLLSPTQTFGVVSDPHMASKHQRLDVLEAAYEEFARLGVKTVFQTGNLIDGYRARLNGGEVLFRNCTDQCVYAADYYPQRSGIITHFITGDCHEGWFANEIGLNIGMHIEDMFSRNGRKDMVFAGHMERDFNLELSGKKQSILRMFHPGGGSSYATSYRPQKIVESYQGGNKPDILLFGHFHKWGSFYPRGVNVILAGCAQDQSGFMRKTGIQAHVGFVTFTIAQDAQGAISQLAPRFYPFYNQEYHIEAGEWETGVLPAIEKLFP